MNIIKIEIQKSLPNDFLSYDLVFLITDLPDPCLSQDRAYFQIEAPAGQGQSWAEKHFPDIPISKFKLRRQIGDQSGRVSADALEKIWNAWGKK